MESNYTFGAIIHYSEEGFINICFPDFENACTCVCENEDYIAAAQDFLALTIADYEDDNRNLPPCGLDIQTENAMQKIVYISVWMPYYRSKIKETYTKKTLTIPHWLDILAKNNNINFSAVLVKGLKEELRLH